MKRTLGKSLGRCIRRLRKERGLSQTIFGERAGFYQTYVSRLENGHANPTVNALDVIATTLGITIFELFRLVEAEHRNPRARTRAAN